MGGRGPHGRRGLVLASLVAVLLAGCGGSGSKQPTAADRHAALDRWTTKADAACQTVNASIGKRGWPVDLVDLDRKVVRAIADVRGAAATIRRQPLPKGSEGKVAPFLKSLKDLDNTLGALSGSTEKLATGQLGSLATSLDARLIEMEKASRPLGLRKCFSHQEHTWLPDAIYAPLFAQQLADLDRNLDRRARAVTRPASTRQVAARNLARLGAVLAGAQDRLGDLEPPAWAFTAKDRYIVALGRVRAALEKGAAELSEPSVTLGEIRPVQQRFNRALRVERKRFKQLARKIGAVPAIPGGAGGGDEDPAVPGGNGTQSA